MDDIRLIHGDCREWLPTIAGGSVDAVICDPPYPEIDRPYGRITEAEWHELMRFVVGECRRILKPSGSAVFILQPNSERVGRMRPWLFEFQAWVCREWNMVQDVWWWNINALPCGGSNEKGLLRASLKACVWLGESDCFRDQDSVLIPPSEELVRRLRSPRSLSYRASYPSGHSVDAGRAYRASERRGGVIPFNVLPIRNVTAEASREASSHPAMTPHDLVDFWVRYIVPPGGVVCDPFAGSGTVPLAALARKRKVIAIEKESDYFATMARRIARPHAPLPRRHHAAQPMPLFDGLDTGDAL